MEEATALEAAMWVVTEGAGWPARAPMEEDADAAMAGSGGAAEEGAAGWAAEATGAEEVGAMMGNAKGKVGMGAGAAEEDAAAGDTGSAEAAEGETAAEARTGVKGGRAGR